MPFIIDTPTNVSNIAQKLKNNGVQAVIRYECMPPGGGWKRLQPNEAKIIGQIGLELGIVYEKAGNHASYFSEGQGYEDAAYCRERTDVFGQPEYSAIYFAVDYDATDSELQRRIIPYFRGVQRAFSGPGAKLKVGCYGSGFVNNTLKTQNLIDLRWITCSLGFNGSRAAVRNHQYELWQTRCDTRLLGIDADFDVANVEDWGQFIPFAKEPAPKKYEAEGVASWYDDKTNASGKPVNNITDMTAAHRTLPFGTKLKVTRQDDGNFVIVDIQDRGPAARTGRIIDLRPAPAKALNMIDDGIINVTIEQI